MFGREKSNVLCDQMINNCNNLEIMVNFLDTQISLDLIKFSNLIDTQTYDATIKQKKGKKKKPIESSSVQSHQEDGLIEKKANASKNCKHTVKGLTQEESIGRRDVESMVTVDSQQREKDIVRKNYKKLGPCANKNELDSNSRKGQRTNENFKKINWWVRLRVKYRRYQLKKNTNSVKN